MYLCMYLVFKYIYKLYFVYIVIKHIYKVYFVHSISIYLHMNEIHTLEALEAGMNR